MGIVVLLITLGLTLILSRNTVLFVTKATVGSVPKDIQISNITPSSFTVSFTTDESVIGTVAFGKDQSMGEITLDDRDQQTGTPAEHKIHFITVQKLDPSTNYYFAITSGTQAVLNNGAPYEVMTAADTGKTATSSATLAGSVALDDGSFPAEGIVSVSSDTSQLLTTLLKPDGTYSLPLDELRTKDLSTYLTLAPETKLQLQVNTPAQQSKAILLTNQISKVPKIVLTKDYDFTFSPDPLKSSVASESAQPASSSAFPQFDEPAPATSPEITTPVDQQQFKDPQPLFKGKALPNAEIEITIQSKKEITAKLQSDSTGRWEFRPPVALDPGNHTITLTSVDAEGLVKSIKRSFTVNAAGSEFIEPSVSPVEVPTEAPTPTAIPRPTLAPSPTSSPTATIVPSPTIDPNASNSANLSQTGSFTTLAGIIMSVLFLTSGVILFLSIAV